MNKRLLLLACCLGLFPGSHPRADLARDMKHLEQRWAEVNYQLKGKTQLAAFARLVADADSAVKENPHSADALVWSGIIKSSYAEAKGWFGAWTLAKRARTDLEAALVLDPEAMDGAAYSTLGELYYRVPRWPLAFGDDERAGRLLRHALELNPDGIDSNYCYGRFLLEEGRHEEARYYLVKAQRAAARPGRTLADVGRQGEIAAALAMLRTP